MVAGKHLRHLLKIEFMITWKVVALEAYPQFEDQQNVVFTLHWQVEGVQGETIVTNCGTVPVNYVSGAAFTAFEQLTQEQVIGWAKAELGEEQVANIEQNVQNALAQRINPTRIMLPPPWEGA